jgi:hypothetical protein
MWPVFFKIFHVICTEFYTGDVHKYLFSVCEFCENWHSESHVLLGKLK